jgi:hypothetical protein
MLRLDRTLQDVVDVVLPGYVAEDSKLETDLDPQIHHHRDMNLSTTTAHSYCVNSSSNTSAALLRSIGPTSGPRRAATSSISSSCGCTTSQLKTMPVAASRVVIPVEIAPVAGSSLRALRRPFLRVDQETPISVLRDYISSMLNIEATSIQLLCNEHPVSLTHSFRFMQKTSWHNPSRCILFQYKQL